MVIPTTLRVDQAIKLVVSAGAVVPVESVPLPDGTRLPDASATATGPTAS